MATVADQEGAGLPQRTNSLQRMLELEKRLKLDRLQGSSATPYTANPPKSFSRSPPQAYHNRTQSLQLNASTNSKPVRRTFGLPSLSIAVPAKTDNSATAMSDNRQPASASSSKRRVSFSAPEQDSESDYDSSICQSPSWEGYGQRQKEKKQEARRKQKEKELAEKEARAARKNNASKLVKVPPNSSKTQNLSEHNGSTTVLHQPGSELSSQQPGEQPNRSNSLTSGLNPSTVLHRPADAGFIGGLKLQQLQQETARQQMLDNPIIGIPPPERGEKGGADKSAAENATLFVYSPSRAVPEPPSPPAPPTDSGSGRHKLRHAARPPARARTNSLKGQLQQATAAVQKWRDRGGRKSLADDSGDERPANSGLLHHSRRQSADGTTSGPPDEHRTLKALRYPPSASKTPTLEEWTLPIAGERGRQSGASHQRTNSLSSVRTTDSGAESGLKRSGSRRNSFTNAMGSLKAAMAALRGGPKDQSQGSLEPSLKASPNADSSSEYLPRLAKPEPLFGVGDEHSPDRPSESSSESSYNHSLPSSASTITTPDTSRPQSERGFSTETGKSTMSYHTATTTVASLQPSSPTDGLALPNGDCTQNARANAQEVEKDPGDIWARTALPIDLDAQSVGTTMTPLCLNGSNASLVPAPLESTTSLKGSLQKSQQRQRQESQRYHDYSSQEEQEEPPLSPPPRNKARLSASSVRHGLPTQRRGAGQMTHPSPVAGVQAQVGVHEHEAVADSAAYLDAARRLTPAPAPPPLAQRPMLSFNKPGGSKSPTESQSPSSHNGSRASINEANATGSPIIASPSPRRIRHQVPPKTDRMHSPLDRISPQPSPTQRYPDPTTEPIAKVLVECCSCHFLHDLPSKVYACMAQPNAVVEDRRLGVSGAISTTVKCPWCAHGMTRRCCPGYAAVVYLKERLH